MKLVVDANVAISAIVRDNVARKLIFNPNLELYSPRYLFEELDEHRDEIMRKAKLSLTDFRQFTNLLEKVIAVVPASAYLQYLDDARKAISDPDDLPYAALAIALTASRPSLPDPVLVAAMLRDGAAPGSARVHDVEECGIWTNDPHFTDRAPEFLQRFGVKIWTSHDLHHLLSA